MRALALILPMLLVTPTLAEEPVTGALPPPPAVDLVAALLMGLAAEQTASLNSETFYVQSPAPGQFHGTTEETRAQVMAFVTEPSRCQFDVAFSMAGVSIAVRFDATQVKGIRIIGAVEEAGFTSYDLRWDAPHNMFQVSQNAGETRGMPNDTRIGTSLTAAQLEVAATALVNHCANR
jgi:hypothetical protein